MLLLLWEKCLPRLLTFEHWKVQPKNRLERQLWIFKSFVLWHRAFRLFSESNKISFSKCKGNKFDRWGGEGEARLIPPIARFFFNRDCKSYVKSIFSRLTQCKSGEDGSRYFFLFFSPFPSFFERNSTPRHYFNLSSLTKVKRTRKISTISMTDRHPVPQDFRKKIWSEK